ncbi:MULTISPECIES: DUF3147 family protein [Deefgea]|uniref:DUF3147 family protein n=1 Tax=Deefgea chitinilytica TaxID=570276 RepID=A0ABS2C9V9_9NEIS|nr:MULTISPECIES: DUF3147 family protein [Deefgea]MBM5570918.1 DUF3147 family protein [Deefgea chitinilytica]MBM9888147.1 DUF3147 family protein [Deefgea sp. CFH1-16]
MGSILLIKLLIGPSLIAATSLAGQRWGQRIAGILAGLPSVALALVAVIWLEQGEQFARVMIHAAPIGLIANSLYMLALAFTSQHFRWPITMLIATICYFLVANLISVLELTKINYMGIYTLAILFITYLAIPKHTTTSISKKLPNSELFIRMGISALLILSISLIAPLFGGDCIGILTGFPIAGAVLPAFTLALLGRDALLKQLKGFMLGLFGFAICFLIWPIWISAYGFAAIIPALMLAVICTASLNYLLNCNLLTSAA